MIAYLDELELFLDSKNISRSEVCIIGSSALALNGLRANKDIDICVKNSVLDTCFPDKNSSLKISDHVEVLVSRKYEKFFGISDDLLIESSEYHTVIDGFKVIRLELEFAAKNILKREKDLEDIKLIADFAVIAESWDWLLVPDLNPQILERSLTFKHRVKLKMKRDLLKLNDGLYNFLKKNKSGFSGLVKFGYLGAKINPNIIQLMPIERLLNYQFNSERHFNRMDLAVRVLAVKEYENSGQMKLYQKMQANRKQDRHSLNRYVQLISDFKQGYNWNYPVTIDSHGRIIDGAHRVSLSLVYGERFVPVSVTQKKFRNSYDLNWFIDKGFDGSEVKLIQNTMNYYLEKIGVSFPYIIWPPAADYIQDILGLLGHHCEIQNVRRFNLGRLDFETLIRRIYKIDDIESWKIERKIKWMTSEDNTFYLISLIYPDPNYRKKQTTRADISQYGEFLKNKIRKNFRREINNYIYDVIVHSGDNYSQNREIYGLLNSLDEK